MLGMPVMYLILGKDCYLDGMWSECSECWNVVDFEGCVKTCFQGKEGRYLKFMSGLWETYDGSPRSLDFVSS